MNLLWIDIPWESPPLVKTPMALPIPLPPSSSCPSLPGSVMMLSFLSKESRLLRMSWLLVRSCTSLLVPVCIAMFGGMCPPDDTIEPSVMMTLTYIRKSFWISHWKFIIYWENICGFFSGLNKLIFLNYKKHKNIITLNLVLILNLIFGYR